MANSCNPKCEVCRVNPAKVRTYVEIGDALHRFLTCEACVVLDGESVDKLMRTEEPKRLELIKEWWDPDARGTTLPEAYPTVDWAKITVDEQDDT